MKFDIIIGNPPYQEKTKSVYDKFIECAMWLSIDHIVMITRNTWLISDTLKDTRNKIIYFGIRTIIEYPVIHEIFSDVSCAITIMHLCNKSKSETRLVKVINNNKVEDFYYSINTDGIISTNKEELSILNSIQQNSNYKTFDKFVLPTEPFRITSNFNVGRNNGTYRIDTKDSIDSTFNIRLAYLENKRLEYKYIKNSDVPNRKDCISKYKIVCGSKLNNSKSVLTNVKIIDKDSVCTSSLAVIFMSNTLDEINNAYKYIHTKFFRFLTRILCTDKMTGISEYRFSLVPVQKFGYDSDIDWNKEIYEIDKQLYDKYKFTRDNIEYIEATIDYL